ncbi:MAG: hypothetical protein KKD99_06380 [Proteobacteria bacterium]|nr:hypothetical protein [Pseudomonadota bacterium]MBU4355878.1 hypothetical protein [Pseudomonadota bacterium]MBU4448194.1 hypothetical protein [Pseudomonadota bacterium]MCG2773892.1 hypothetical protein [Desulfobacterales bacterium]
MENLHFSGCHLFLGCRLIFRAGFPCEIGYYDNDKFANKIDRFGDSIHNELKLFGFPVAHVPCPGAALAGVRRGCKEVMPPWPEDI